MLTHRELNDDFSQNSVIAQKRQSTVMKVTIHMKNMLITSIQKYLLFNTCEHLKVAIILPSFEKIFGWILPVLTD